MILTKQMTKEDIILQSIEEIYKGPSTLQLKIAALIFIRRDNHGNDKIQNKCSTYLTQLYEEKYRKMEELYGN